MTYNAALMHSDLFHTTNKMNLNRFCYLLLILAASGSIFTPHPLVMWCLLVNVLTLVIYGADKMAARKA